MFGIFLIFMYAEKENFSDMANDIITSFKEEDEVHILILLYARAFQQALDINTNERFIMILHIFPSDKTFSWNTF